MRIGFLVNLAEFAHELPVDLEATGGVDDHGVNREPGGLLQGSSDQSRRPARTLGEDGHSDSFAESLQLFDRRRTLKIGRHQERPSALRLEVVGELGRSGGLARPLQSHDKDHERWRGRLERSVGLSESCDQLLVDDLYDLLARSQALGNLGPDRPGPHTFEKLADNADIDIGFEKCEPDLAQRSIDVGLPQPSLAADPAEYPVETFGDRVEHVPDVTGPSW